MTGAARMAAAVTVGLALLGVPLGLLWSALAPRAQAVVQAGGVQLVDPNTKAFVAADGIFLLLTVAAGILGAVVALVLGGARHGVATTVALTVGGLLAAYVAWRVGHRIGLPQLRRVVAGPRSTTTRLDLDLRAKSVLVGWPLGGVLTMLVWSVSTRRRAEAEPISWR